MASIIRNESRGTWQIQWNDGNRWRRKTVVPRKPGWSPGDKLPKKVPPTVTEALALYQKREESARSSRSVTPDWAVDQFLVAYRAGYEGSVRARTLTEFDMATRRFLTFCTTHKLTLVDQVTPEVIDRFVTTRHRTASHATIQKEVGLLSGAWSKAVKLRQIKDNPWKSATIPGKPGTVRDSSWTPEEFARLCEAAPPALRSLLVLGCHTGLRVHALTRLEMRDVKWATDEGKGFGHIRVRKELDKSGKGYQIPISRACHDLIAGLTIRTGHPFVLSKANGQPVKSTSSVGGSIHVACRKAGLPRPDSPCHAMRRTFGRWAVLGHLTGRPVPLYVVSRWLGHSSTAMTERYLNIREAESSDWMAEVEGKAE